LCKQLRIARAFGKRQDNINQTVIADVSRSTRLSGTAMQFLIAEHWRLTKGRRAGATSREAVQ
jgi:hypothetical protein